MAFLSNPTFQIQFLVILGVILIFVPINYTSHIELNSDGGYSKIVVAVSDRVIGKQHNWSFGKLKQTFEEFFWQASQQLYVLTKHHTFFKEIRVLIPHTWDKYSTKLGDATYESYREADVRCDDFNPSPELRDLYTRQRGRCGEKGDYIYLDSKFLLHWKEKRDPEHVTRFVHEWLKLRYGISNNLSEDNPDCGFRSVWEVIVNSVDLKGFKKYHKQMSIYELKPSIDYVKSSMDVVIVTDGFLLTTNESRKILIYTLKRFINNFPDNGRVRYVMPYVEKQMSKREPIDSHLQFIDNITEVNYTHSLSFFDGITRELMKLTSDSSRQRHLFVITNKPEISGSTFNSFGTYGENIFLLTLTPNGCKIASSNPRDTRIFLDKPTQFLWVNVKTTDVDNCDYTPAKYIDNALVQFFTKLGNEDFYADKIKIHDYSLAINENGRFILPFTGASITFNVYPCFQNNGSVSLTIYVDDSVVEEVSGSILDYSYSYVWKHSYAKGIAISFKTNISTSKFVEAVVWVDNINKTNTELVLDVGIDTKTTIHNNHKKPFVIYAYNPNMYVLTVDMVSNHGKRFTFDLTNDGNEGDDLYKGEYIYSQYIIDPTAYGEQVLPIKINARTKNGDNIIQLDFGLVYVQDYELKDFSPRRINNFNLEHIDEDSSNAHFSWSAPSTYDNRGLVNAYYLVCNSNANNLSVESVDETAIYKYKINLLPKKPGEIEYYTWKIPSLNTTEYCIMAATNEKNLSSESSNVVAVIWKPITPTLEPASVEAVVGIIVGCCVLILSIAILLCIYKRRRRNTPKQKVTPDVTITRQLITHNPITKQVGSSKEHIPLNVTSSNCPNSNSSIDEPAATYNETSSPNSHEITRVQEEGYLVGNINNISPLDDGYIQQYAIYEEIVDRKSRKCRIM